jgi:hypothetical protein
MTDKTKMIFRTYLNGGDVVALMPEVPHDRNGYYCVSYQRVGQHGAASTGIVEAHTTPATPDERAPLMRELTKMGYAVTVCYRESRKMRAARMDAARP